MKTNRNGVDFLYIRDIINREEWHAARRYKSVFLSLSPLQKQKLKADLGLGEYRVLEALVIDEETIVSVSRKMADHVAWVAPDGTKTVLTAETIARTRIKPLLKRALRLLDRDQLFGMEMQARS